MARIPKPTPEELVERAERDRRFEEHKRRWRAEEEAEAALRAAGIDPRLPPHRGLLGSLGRRRRRAALAHLPDDALYASAKRRFT